MERVVFISHSSKNADIASEMCEFLESNGKRCFIAPRDIRTGKEYAEEIMLGIDRSSYMILVLTQESNDSPHVLREIERAVSKNIPIIVYKEEDVLLNKSMEYFLMTNQWLEAEFSRDFSKLLNCIDDGITNETNNVLEDTVNKKRNKVIIAMISLMCVFTAISMIVVCGVMIFSSRGKTDSEKNNESNIEKQKNDEDNLSTKDIEIGDVVKFGSYLDEEIEWYVIDSYEDGTVELLSKYILTMKAYDAAESGKYNYHAGTDYYQPENYENADDKTMVYARGNNDWSKSNIRTWLNSNKEVVEYTDGIPNKESMADKSNEYDVESGFLHNFTNEEYECIVKVQNKTKGNSLSIEKEIITEDRVYLLLLDDLGKLKKAGIELYAEPTPEAVKQNKSPCYLSMSLSLKTENHYWRLREPADEIYKTVVVSHENNVNSNEIEVYSVGVEGIGIRPAMTVKTDNLTVIEK